MNQPAQDPRPAQTVPNPGADAEPPSKPLPFVAPCRTLQPDAPLRWLRLGLRDLRRAPRQSLGYGVATLVLCLVVGTVWVKLSGSMTLLALLSGITLIGPVLAIGLYSISCQLQAGLVPVIGYCLRDSRRHMTNQALFASALFMLFLIWIHMGSLLHIFFPHGEIGSDLKDTLLFFGIGTAVGGVFAALTFCISAFSLPMIMDRQTDLVTAIITSINAALRNRQVMFTWGTIIVAAMIIVILTGMLTLIVIFPILGHATWHAYRETIDASAWPTHG